MRVTLPWPSPALSPNARLHWAKKAAAVQKYRAACGWAAKAAGLRPIEADALRVSLTFCPPDLRRRDADNLLSSVKGGLDGLADVLGVDDSRWSLTLERGGTVKGGAVIVEIETGAAG
jgi:crossover junction endodeoxyribonuclease RusA